MKRQNNSIYLLNFPSDDGVFGIELEAALKKQNETVYRCDPEELLIDLGNGRDLAPALVGEDGPIDVTDALFFIKKRKGTNSFLSSLLLNFLPLVGARSYNPLFKSHTKNISKPAQAIKLLSNGFAIPHTILVSGETAGRFQVYIESKLQYPFVLKASGSGGRHVFKVHSFDEVTEKLIDVEPERKEVIVLQEFVTNSHEECRVVMLLGEVVAVIMRGSDDFYNNVAQGGSTWRGELSTVELEICQKVAQMSGLDYLGIDFMRAEDGTLLFTEVQTGPSISLTKKINPDAVEDMALIIREKQQDRTRLSEKG